MGCFGYICKHCGTPIIGSCTDEGGEKCILIHVRNGKELGRVEGHYNEYGGVSEEEHLDEKLKFRGEENPINSHYEIHQSEFGMDDSYLIIADKKIYNGKEVNFQKFYKEKYKKDLKNINYDISKLSYFDIVNTIIKKSDSLTELFYKYQTAYGKYLCINNEKEKTFLEYNMDIYLDIIFDESIWIFFEGNNDFTKEFNNLENVTREHYSGIVAYHSKCYHKAIKEGTFNLIPSKQDPDQSWGEVREEYR